MQNTTLGSSVVNPGAGMPQDPLEMVATFLDRSVLVDRNYLDLSEQLQIPKHSEYRFPSLGSNAILVPPDEVNSRYLSLPPPRHSFIN